MSNIQLTKDFIAKWEAMDADGIIEAFTDEPFYHNIPMPPLTSKAAIREFIDPFFAMTTQVKWEIHFIAEDENGAVLTERLDTFAFGDKWLKIPVMGTFEFEGGKLARWRDYFDLRDFETQMAAIQGG